MRPILALLLVVALPGEALAWEPGPKALARLEAGRPYVEVRGDADDGLIKGAIDIEAPPAAVWKVVVDCNLAPRMVASLKSCRVIERDPAGAWDVREQISKPGFLPSVRSVFRSDYDPPHLVRYRRVDGDLRSLEGEWRLIPLRDGAATRALYENRAAMPYRLPGALMRMAARHDVAAALVALRRESLARR